MIGKWNRALVTGASSGIGRELAQQLAADGTDLILVARDQPRLESLAKELVEQHSVDAEVLAADLSDRAQLTAVSTRIQADERPVDLVVNNAGFGFSGLFHELDLEDQTAIIDVNITALQRLSHAAATAMVPRERGGILNISSMAGHFVAPRSATYAASKAFVSSFTEALHEELAPFGITVTAICPGLTRTEFHDRAKVDPTAYPNVVWQSAEDVATQSLAALNKGKARVVTGSLNKAIASGISATPSKLVRKIANARRP